MDSRMIRQPRGIPIHGQAVVIHLMVGYLAAKAAEEVLAAAMILRVVET